MTGLQLVLCCRYVSMYALNSKVKSACRQKTREFSCSAGRDRPGQHKPLKSMLSSSDRGTRVCRALWTVSWERLGTYLFWNLSSPSFFSWTPSTPQAPAVKTDGLVSLHKHTLKIRELNFCPESSQADSSREGWGLGSME